MTLERDVAHEKARLEPRWAELVYDGLWYSPSNGCWTRFLPRRQRYVTGEVRLRCEPGRRRTGSAPVLSCGQAKPGRPVRTRPGHILRRDRFRHQDAEGFVRIFGLGIETWASKQGPVQRAS